MHFAKWVGCLRSAAGRTHNTVVRIVGCFVNADCWLQLVKEWPWGLAARTCAWQRSSLESGGWSNSANCEFGAGFSRESAEAGEWSSTNERSTTQSLARSLRSRATTAATSLEVEIARRSGPPERIPQNNNEASRLIPWKARGRLQPPWIPAAKGRKPENSKQAFWFEKRALAHRQVKTSFGRWEWGVEHLSQAVAKPAGQGVLNEVGFVGSQVPAPTCHLSLVVALPRARHLTRAVKVRIAKSRPISKTPLHHGLTEHAPTARILEATTWNPGSRKEERNHDVAADNRHSQTGLQAPAAIRGRRDKRRQVPESDRVFGVVNPHPQGRQARLLPTARED